LEKYSASNFEGSAQRVKEWARAWKDKEYLLTLWTTFYAKLRGHLHSMRCARMSGGFYLPYTSISANPIF
jgi:hypothetical protein